MNQQKRPAQIVVEAPALKAGAAVPRDYTADGHDRSPALNWHDVPPATRELAVVMVDLDETSPVTPGQPIIHWVVYRIRPTVTALKAGLPVQEFVLLPPDTDGAFQAYTMYDAAGYRGPQPPPGKAHRFTFTVYALDRPLGLPQAAAASQVVKAIAGHVIGEGSIVVTYQRKPR